MVVFETDDVAEACGIYWSLAVVLPDPELGGLSVDDFAFADLCVGYLEIERRGSTEYLDRDRTLTLKF